MNRKSVSELISCDLIFCVRVFPGIGLSVPGIYQKTQTFRAAVSSVPVSTRTVPALLLCRIGKRLPERSEEGLRCQDTCGQLFHEEAWC